MNRTRGLVILGKLPVPGRVKTRLVPPLTSVQAAELYGAFVDDLLERFAAAAPDLGMRVTFAYAADGDLDRSAEEARRRAPAVVQVKPQRDGDLGERIAGARHDSGTEHAVLIGADSPLLGLERVNRAFQALDQADCVVGPVEDGGYDLIGFSGPAEPFLRAVPWSTSDVLEVTRQRARQADCSLLELDCAYDVDRPEDLTRLAADPGLSAAPRTEAWLSRWPGRGARGAS